MDLPGGGYGQPGLSTQEVFTMRIVSAVCFAVLAASSLSAQAADISTAEAKCQAQLAANQEGLAKAKLVAQLAGNQNATDKLAAVDGGCARLNAQAADANAQAQAAEPTQVTQAVESVTAAKDALKGLGSMFGK